MKLNIIRKVKMVLEDFKDPKDRMIRIKSKSNEVFKKAYEELRASTDYAIANFGNTAISQQYQTVLNEYTPRYNLLTRTN